MTLHEIRLSPANDASVDSMAISTGARHPSRFIVDTLFLFNNSYLKASNAIGLNFVQIGPDAKYISHIIDIPEDLCALMALNFGENQSPLDNNAFSSAASAIMNDFMDLYRQHIPDNL